MMTDLLSFGSVIIVALLAAGAFINRRLAHRKMLKIVLLTLIFAAILALGFSKALTR